MFSFAKIKKTLSNAEAVVSSTFRYGYIGAMTGSIISVPILWGFKSIIPSDHSYADGDLFDSNQALESCEGVYYQGNFRSLEICVEYYYEDNFTRRIQDGNNVFAPKMTREEFYFDMQCIFVFPEVVGFVIGAAIGLKKGLENINPKTITRIGNNNHAILSEESCKKSHPHRFEQFFIANQNQQHPDLVEENDFVILDKPISLPGIN